MNDFLRFDDDLMRLIVTFYEENLDNYQVYRTDVWEDLKQLLANG